MTSDLGGLIRRTLLAEAAQVDPPDAIDLIRARISRPSWRARIRNLINRLAPRFKETR